MDGITFLRVLTMAVKHSDMSREVTSCNLKLHYTECGQFWEAVFYNNGMKIYTVNEKMLKNSRYLGVDLTNINTFYTKAVDGMTVTEALKELIRLNEALEACVHQDDAQAISARRLLLLHQRYCINHMYKIISEFKNSLKL